MTADAAVQILAMSFATTSADAHACAAAAVLAGAEPEEAKRAIELWQQMQTKTVQRVWSAA